MIEKINLKELTKVYNHFLMGNGNVGCPMLATALSELIGGKPTVGKFDKDPHCWIEQKYTKKIYDLNNLIGQIVCLILSDIDDKAYKKSNKKPIDFALELGINNNQFHKWRLKFKTAMAKNDDGGKPFFQKRRA